MSAEAHRFRIAIIGSGMSAYGVCSSLCDKSNVAIDVFDIGLSSISTDVSREPPPNSIPSSHSYYPYGCNDTKMPLRLYSKRLCSSHAYGGFSTVYSGSVLLPSDTDFSDWPLAAIPSAAQIATSLAKLCFDPPAPTPLSLRCSHPSPDTQPYIITRQSSFIVSPSTSSALIPFRASDYFSGLRETGKSHIMAKSM